MDDKTIIVSSKISTLLSPNLDVALFQLCDVVHVTDQFALNDEFDENIVLKIQHILSKRVLRCDRRDDLLAKRQPANERQDAICRLSVSLFGDREEGRSRSSPSNQTVDFYLDKLFRLMPLVDFIELDANHVAFDEILPMIPASQRIITLAVDLPERTPSSFQHEKSLEGALQHLWRRYGQVADVDAFLIRVVCNNALVSQRFLSGVSGINKSINTIAYDPQASSLWTRITACYVGAPIVFSRLDDDSDVSLRRMEKNYRLSCLPKKIDCLYGIAGRNCLTSFSPMVHNEGLQRLGMQAVYLPFCVSTIESLDDYLKMLYELGFSVGGLTLTGELKSQAESFFSVVREDIGKAYSANTLLNKGGQYFLESTDDCGLAQLMGECDVEVEKKSVAVIGCGASGRIAAQQLCRSGAKVKLFNRGKRRGVFASTCLGLPYEELSELDLQHFDIVINTVPFPVGRNLPIAGNLFRESSILIDFVYCPQPNALFSLAKEQNLKVINGAQMLKTQLSLQFKQLTGQDIPVEAFGALTKILSGQSTSSSEVSGVGPLLEKTG